MSKNYYRNYKNYQNIQKEDVHEEPVVVALEEEVVEERDIEESVVDESAIEEPPANNTIKGVVFNCAKLRMRENPNTDAEIICELKADTNVIIDEEQSTKDFYKIYTEAGAEGYCMKQFVAVE